LGALVRLFAHPVGEPEAEGPGGGLVRSFAHQVGESDMNRGGRPYGGVISWTANAPPASPTASIVML
jgi:hypothetical protein